MTPDQIRADDDDSDRQRSTFDRADNTARLALELAEAKREIAALHRDALAEAQAYRAMFARAQEAEAKVAAVEALAESLVWKRPERSPCSHVEDCCGSEDSCDAMNPVVRVVGHEQIRAALKVEP